MLLADRGVDLAYSRIRADMVRLLEHFDLTDGATQYVTNREAAARLAEAARNRAKLTDG